MSERNPFGGTITHLSPAEVRQGLADGTILLVDVRETNEIQAERVPGATPFPLSKFDPSALPDPAGKRLVFSCRSGQRSQQAAAYAQKAGLPYEEHMKGGIIGWREAGFEVDRG
ncbi:rhodanese-like domain-containing protein [Xanthobacter autotrophicus]|jgi:rhodanese-related sulfurtransferase|uniref:Rhodanese-like domain-containing protein n=1 Tax=Xanthobacter autotrophicus TaxID=280 RepID=A0A6C1KDD5_XANAU|nr:rhodanese-like domain-containing protein [Xanthobacter autotrophicus]TLX41254.1 rhodanese-like domain-containing protein [Xanthobacter autotrophicus]